jgi:hypothetical protein
VQEHLLNYPVSIGVLTQLKAKEQKGIQEVFLELWIEETRAFWKLFPKQIIEHECILKINCCQFKESSKHFLPTKMFDFYIKPKRVPQICFWSWNGPMDTSSNKILKISVEIFGY